MNDMTPATRPSVERERNETAPPAGRSEGSRDEVPGPGQYADPEWNDDVYYNWHRYYIPHIGRYDRADPININGMLTEIFLVTKVGIPSVTDHPYLYVANCPTGYNDPSGLDRYDMCRNKGQPGTVLFYLCVKEVDKACRKSPYTCCYSEKVECFIYAPDENASHYNQYCNICESNFQHCMRSLNASPPPKSPSPPPEFPRYPNPPGRGPKVP